MGAAYTILGRTVQPHVLALATILGTVGGATYKLSGSSKTPETASNSSPAIASSGSQESGEMDIEKLLDNYLQQADKK
ncbi:LAFA_0E13410g1_1 [Lachancea sp. 'fantastica']|nr:LAFA_0E13410g1_1 [Lachancea sp. 'fantastica']